MDAASSPDRLVLDSRMTGEHFLFLESYRTAGAFRFTYTLAKGSAGPGPHYHESETEVFRMISGVLTFWLDGVKHELRPGDSLTVPAGVRHAFKNLGDEPVVCDVTFDGPRMEDTFVPLATEIVRRGLTGLPLSMTVPMWVTLVGNRASLHTVGLIRWITYAGGSLLMKLGKKPLPPTVGWAALPSRQAASAHAAE